MTALFEDFLPVYDVCDEVAVVVGADRGPTWEALLDVDLGALARSVPVVGALGAIRVIPELASRFIHGDGMPETRGPMRLQDLAGPSQADGDWVLLGERPEEEIALGLVGKFWLPVIEYAAIADAHAFRGFAEPGFAKTVYSLSIAPLDDGRSLLRGTMRTATTDEYARRWFRRYWTLGVGSGAHVLVHALLESVRKATEGAHVAAGV